MYPNKGVIIINAASTPCQTCKLIYWMMMKVVVMMMIIKKIIIIIIPDMKRETQQLEQQRTHKYL